MGTMNPGVDTYLQQGCMRCSYGGTPQCKVNDWREELIALRAIVLDSDLTEEVKWSVPCYTYDGNNVLIISAFKEYCAISFFKGVLLKDPENVLVAQTKNMQATRIIHFTSVDEIKALEPVLRDYIVEAIEVDKAELKVELKKTEDLDMPEELLMMFEEDPAFQEAFDALTPGRQRGYLYYFSGAKQSKTRISRIEKSIPKIFDGLGLYD